MSSSMGLGRDKEAHEFLDRQLFFHREFSPESDGDHPTRPMLWSLGLSAYYVGVNSVHCAHLTWFRRYRTHLL